MWNCGVGAPSGIVRNPSQLPLVSLEEQVSRLRSGRLPLFWYPLHRQSWSDHPFGGLRLRRGWGSSPLETALSAAARITLFGNLSFNGSEDQPLWELLLQLEWGSPPLRTAPSAGMRITLFGSCSSTAVRTTLFENYYFDGSDDPPIFGNCSFDRSEDHPIWELLLRRQWGSPSLGTAPWMAVGFPVLGTCSFD